MSISCHSNRNSPTNGIVTDPKGFRFRDMGQFVEKIPENKTFKLISDGTDMILTMKAANKTAILANTLVIRPVFWDAKSEFATKSIFRNKFISIFEITQLSNKRVGYTITFRKETACEESL